MPSVFWSWQSDVSHRETRGLIKDALEVAVREINSSVDPAERPDSSLSIDHDTKGLSGSPDIVASILQKIENATAFVADVTPIGIVSSLGGRRHVQNPNVLIELGYAKRALGLERVIQVWNTAITDCSIEHLPFDMRGRRGPLSYHLPVGASTEALREERLKLAKKLSDALGAISPVAPPEENWPLWRSANPMNPAIWFEEGEQFTINEPGHGPGQKSFPTAPTRYARILPKEWVRPHEIEHSSLLGHVSGISWGRTTGGFLTYQGSIVRPELADSPNGTMLFLDTGEVWAIDRFIVAQWRNKLMIEGDDMFGGVASFLAHQLVRMTKSGTKFPMKIRLGVTGLLGSHWPLPNPIYGDPQAVEDRVEVEDEVVSFDRRSLEPLVVRYWTQVRDAYGLPPPDTGRIEKAMRLVEE
ncbi:hypothetical protein [Parerythrobacter aestuarii]|uniref:hypothetical protein n=1 Tax=Parerythrobacter aestuarii TaxID=3020909 RepID=UPI0024DE4CD7|nr:hypothetical protein [Parerythrobacter aestuarii]